MLIFRNGPGNALMAPANRGPANQLANVVPLGAGGMHRAQPGMAAPMGGNALLGGLPPPGAMPARMPYARQMSAPPGIARQAMMRRPQARPMFGWWPNGIAR